jgi:hypothetical protein
MKKKNERRFYVYAFLRSNDSEHGKKFTPYYIGKGTGKRMFEKYGRIVPSPENDSYIAIVQDNLTEREAFSLEIYCIQLYGRIQTNTGILRNRTDGGDGPSGMIMSQETRERMSLARRGEKHPLWGKPRPDHVKRMISEANRGANNFHYGKPMPETTRRKISEANKGKPKGEAHRQKLADANCKYEYLLHAPDGTAHAINNLNRFCKENGLDTSTMNKMIKAGRSHKGWTGRIVKRLR